MTETTDLACTYAALILDDGGADVSVSEDEAERAEKKKAAAIDRRRRRHSCFFLARFRRDAVSLSAFCFEELQAASAKLPSRCRKREKLCVLAEDQGGYVVGVSRRRCRCCHQRSRKDAGLFAA